MANTPFVIKKVRSRPSVNHPWTYQWEVSGTPAGGSRLRIRRNMKTEALRILKEKNAQWAARTLPLTTKQDRSIPTLIDCFDRFIESRRRTQKAGTVRAHVTRRNQVQVWLDTSGGLDRPINMFRRVHFEEMMSYFKTEALSRYNKPFEANTVNAVLDSLNAVFRFTISWQEEENQVREIRGDMPLNWVSSNPIMMIQGMKSPKSARFSAWTISEQREIEKNIQEFYRMPFRFMITTGLRADELKFLRWQDIDFEERTINICIHDTDTFRPKHDHERLVHFGKVAQECLQGQKGKHPMWVFSSMNGKNQISPREMGKKINAAAAQTGLSISGKVLHCTRATYITNSFRKGIPINSIMDSVGHTDPKVTLKYSTVEADGQREAACKLDDVF